LSSAPDFFDSPGPENTDRVIDAVARRISYGGIAAVVVASTSGLSALKLARALAANSRTNGTRIVCVSEPPSYAEVVGRWPTVDPAIVAELARLGVRIVNDQPFVFHNSVIGEAKAPLTAEALLRSFLEKCFGSGMKVAVECLLMATSAGAYPHSKPCSALAEFHSA